MERLNPMLIKYVTHRIGYDEQDGQCLDNVVDRAPCEFNCSL